MTRHPCMAVPLFVLCLLSSHAFAQAPERLSLAAAQARARAVNPALEAQALRTAAGEADARQAGRRSNPEVELEVENVAGSGAWSGLDGAETTAALRQRFEPGGALARRRDLADRSAVRGRFEQEQAGWTLDAEVRRAYYALLAAQARDGLAESALEQARQLRAAAEARVSAGAAPRVELTRSRMAEVTAALEQTRTADRGVAARDALCAFWKGSPGDWEAAEDLDELPPAPDADRVSKLLEQGLALRTATARIEEQAAAQDLAIAEAYPELDLGLGLKHNQEGVLLLSAPLPLFDRNQSAHRAARLRGEALQLDRAALARAQGDEGRRLHHVWQTRAVEVRRLDAEVLPEAEHILAELKTGYETGAFSLFEVLDARRVLLEARRRRIDALEAGHEAVADLLRGCGPELLASPKEVSP